MITFCPNKESHVRKMTCVLSKRGYIAAHVSLSDGHALHWRAFVFEAATNKECPANDDWARTPRHADIDEYRERVATHD